MKTKIYITIVIIFTVINAIAQPLPPTTPQGNPVPIGGLAGLALLLGAMLLTKNKNK